MLSDCLTCLSLTIAGCSHESIVSGGNYPSNLPHFRWVNKLLGNLKTNFICTLHNFNFDN